MGETCVVVLITQRSEVQILPPLPVSAAQGPFPVGEGLWHAGRCSKSRSHARDLYGLTARQGDTRRDSVDTLDGSTPDRWVLCPGLRRGHRPGRVPRSTSVSG